MNEQTNRLFEINTQRNALYPDNSIALKQEVKDIEKKVNNIIDWLINSKRSLAAIPINIRKYAAYANKLKDGILQIPIVLRKRLLYARILNF